MIDGECFVMSKQTGKFLYWTPRTLSILFILFLAMFSLDVFDTPDASAGELALGLLMHNIPALILLAVLIISWKHEIVGGVAFLLASVMFMVFSAFRLVDNPIDMVFQLIIAGPAFLIGILFLLNWKQKKSRKVLKNEIPFPNEEPPKAL
jgi:hypothetical protein